MEYWRDLLEESRTDNSFILKVVKQVNDQANKGLKKLHSNVWKSFKSKEI